ncbi:MAG: T9SS type A sorting domain-containing protein [Chitinivibrionales bacterium]|nr:T9SS type A sorting domain-containing protein [Chitinivibrionales bacterium]
MNHSSRNTQKRSKTTFFLFHIVLLLMLSLISFATAALEGFYKDIFIDEGTRLRGPANIPSIEYIGSNHEWMRIDVDTALQNRIMFKSANDSNGRLLYPDGQPRFAVIYYHGGSMSHSYDCGIEGRRLIRMHYLNGGSQCGSCAGSYMMGSDGASYFKLWPGKVNSYPNESVKEDVQVQIPPGSPLLKYYDFGGNNMVDKVFHNNGGCIKQNEIPMGTVIVGTFMNYSFKNLGACYSWKDSDSTGRATGICSHPEGSNTEDAKQYMGGVFRYSFDGLGVARVKQMLENGVTVTMDKSGADDNPAFMKIGDRQYHHFIVSLPKNYSHTCTITLTGTDGYDFHLFAGSDTFAFKTTARYADTSLGAQKKLVIPNASGTLFIGVKLATTVEEKVVTVGIDKYIEYEGALEVLNGIAYSICAQWSGSTPLTTKETFTIVKPTLHQGRGTIAIAFGSMKAASSVDQVQIFDLKGRIFFGPTGLSDTKSFQWTAPSGGIYILRLRSGSQFWTKQFSIP